MKKLIVCLLVLVMALTPVVLAGCKKADSSVPSGANVGDDTDPTTGGFVDPRTQKATTDPDYYQLFDTIPEYYTPKGLVDLDCEYFDRDEYLDTYLQYMRAEEYRDYSEVDFDYDYHTYLNDQGLFWAYADEDGTPRMVADRDHEQVDQLLQDGVIDPAKPTIVFIHGIQMGSYNRNVIFTEAAITAPDVLSPSDPLYSDYVDEAYNMVQTNTLYYRNGFNVLNFVYNRFSDEGAIDGYLRDKDGELILDESGNPVSQVFMANRTIESKVWSTDGVGGVRYRLPSGLYSDGTNESGTPVDGAECFADPEHAIDFTVAEYLCGEWIRCVKRLSDKGVTLSDKGVRFAGHSMGCEVTTVGTYLLTELVRVGQIDKSYLPERVCMLDGYMGFYAGEKFDAYATDMGASIIQMTSTVNCHVAWTGKLMERGAIASMMCAAVRQIVANDIAYEYYIDGTPTSMVSTVGNTMRTLLFSMVAVVKYTGSFRNTHNSVRSVYCSSQVCPVPDLVDQDGNVIGKAISAASTTAEIKAAHGKIFVMTEGASTGSAIDDKYQLESMTQAGQYQRPIGTEIPYVDPADLLEDEDEE